MKDFSNNKKKVEGNVCKNMRQKKREKSLLLVDPRHQINSFTFKRKKNIYIQFGCTKIYKRY